jgi:hypothetical protein
MLLVIHWSSSRVMTIHRFHRGIGGSDTELMIRNARSAAGEGAGPLVSTKTSARNEEMIWALVKDVAVSGR